MVRSWRRETSVLPGRPQGRCRGTENFGLETEWVLRSVYGFSAVQCAKALSDFAGLPRVSLEDATAAAKALGWMPQGVDFADGLHLAEAEGCEAFISLDQNFVKAVNALGGIKARAP